MKCKLTLMIMAFIAFASCNKGPGKLSVSPASISVGASGGEYEVKSEAFSYVTVRIPASGEFSTSTAYEGDSKERYSLSVDWVSVWYESSTGTFPTVLHVEVAENTTGEKRSAEVCVYGANLEDSGTIRITQKNK